MVVSIVLSIILSAIALFLVTVTTEVITNMYSSLSVFLQCSIPLHALTYLNHMR